MSDPPGPLIGSGRAADVYDLGDGTVVRRYRTPNAGLEREAEVMRYVRSKGYPAPRVHAVDGRDLVMDKVDGRTMMSRLQDAPAKVWTYGRLLARLQAALAEIPAPDFLMAAGWSAGADDRVLHLDLHPMNVMIAAGGPVVIDWTNAAGGPPGFDAAMTYVEMATYEVDGHKERIGRAVLLRRFTRLRGRRLIDSFIGAACDHRLADSNTTPGERVAIAELRTRTAGRDRRE